MTFGAVFEIMSTQSKIILIVNQKKGFDQMFWDIESGEKITLGQLMEEYEQNRKAMPSEFNYSFDEYVKNCLVENNGTLERL